MNRSTPPVPKYVAASPREEENRGHYSINDFIENTGQRDLGQGVFELEQDRLLEINLNGKVWTKMGSMVAYLGSVKFIREGVLEHGLGKLVKKAVTGEGLALTKAEGQGKVYLADAGKKISVINLDNQSIYVNGNDLLAFEYAVKWDIKMMKKIAGMLSGGLFNVKLEGTGMIAITTHYDPLTLRVTNGNPVYTDPNATVAWSGNLKPDLKTDISLKSFVGRTSGESVQMKFEGEGFVVIQPYEEVAYSPTAPK
ncbi:MAG: AIM24 family protein [Methanosarcinaceae archaeon]|nr:AIM24 family protein [Methanosarcinaceae archaeon]